MSGPVDPGKSEAMIREATGKGWDEWLAVLDAAGAEHWTHTEIAAWIDPHVPIGGRWTQAVAAGYERLKRREAHQHPDGFSAGVTKTFNLPVGQLVMLFTDESMRDQWLEPRTISLYSLKYGYKAGFDVRDRSSRLDAQFTAEGDATSMVALRHGRIATRAELDAWRVFWDERLARLAERLGNHG